MAHISNPLLPRLAPALLAGLFAVACLGGGFAIYKHSRAKQLADGGAAGDVTASTTPAAPLGPSGLPLPRFVTLKTDKVNVRKGPGSDRELAWVYSQKGLPVEITAEFETWRKIRDSEGSEGWILKNMLSSKREALVAPGRKGTYVNLMYGPSVESGPVAKLASGVLADIKSCDGVWCRIVANGYDGYVDQNVIWGAYPGEIVN